MEAATVNISVNFSFKSSKEETGIINSLEDPSYFTFTLVILVYIS